MSFLKRQRFIQPSLVTTPRKKQKMKDREEGDIPPRIQFLAGLADASYKDQEDRMDYLKNDIPFDRASELFYDTEHSNKKMAVFVDRDHQAVYTSFRGTKVSDADDLLTDTALVVGQEQSTARFRNSAENYGKVLKDYEGYQHIAVGHSLGGSVAEYMKTVHGGHVNQVHSFNPGSGIKSAEQGSRDNVFKYHIRGDPVSVISSDQKNTTIYEKHPDSNAHSVQQFLL